MKRTLFLLLLLGLNVWTAWGDNPAPPSTAFTRDLLRSTNAPEAVTKLGFLSTNMTSITNYTGNGANATNLNASELRSGTVPDARFPATLPAASGANLTALNGTQISSGTVPLARLPSGVLTNNYAGTINATAFTGDGSGLTGISGGGGGSATNLTPWASDINGAGHRLTNAIITSTVTGDGSGLTNVQQIYSPTNGVDVYFSGLGTVSASGGAYDASAGNGRYVLQNVSAYTNTLGNGYGLRVVGLSGFLTNSDHSGLTDFICKRVQGTGLIGGTWQDFSLATLSGVLTTWSTNYVPQTTFFSSGPLAAPTGSFTNTLSTSNLLVSGSISNPTISGSFVLDTMSIGATLSVFDLANANYVGDAGLTTNLATMSGAIWQKMPVPSLMPSTYPDVLCNNDETLVISNILNAATNGLGAAWGSNLTFLVEDGQYQPSRSSGLLVANATHFPSGFPALVNCAHTNGFKIWSYISAGASCCPSGDPGTPLTSLGSDLKQIVEWGFDGLIIDECGIAGSANFAQNRRYVLGVVNSVGFNDLQVNTNNAPNPRGLGLIMAQNDGTSSYLPFETLYNCNMAGINTVPYVATTQSNLLQIAYQNLKFSNMVGPGHYLDATSWPMSAFATNLLMQNLDVYYMLCQPIQTSIISPSGDQLTWLTNSEAIAIFQDKAVVPAWVASSNSLNQVWVRPLGGTVANNPVIPLVPNPQPLTSSNAVLLINGNSTSQSITLYATNLGQSATTTITVRDPWQKKAITNFVGSWTVTVGSSNMTLLTTVATPERLYGETIYGDVNKTNALNVSPSGVVVSNAAGSVTMTGGGTTNTGNIQSATMNTTGNATLAGIRGVSNFSSSGNGVGIDWQHQGAVSALRSGGQIGFGATGIATIDAFLESPSAGNLLVNTNLIARGTITATNAFMMPTNYVAANFTPVAGMVSIVASNGVLYKVTQLSTNLLSSATP